MISIFDLFSIGIGPSSSHTVGPMRAAKTFCTLLENSDLLSKTKRLQTELFGSLAFTGKGHGTDVAILAGLEGNTPEGVEPDNMVPRSEEIKNTHSLSILGKLIIPFHYDTDLVFNLKDHLPRHTNGMRFTAFDEFHQPLKSRCYYSIGGGFIIDEMHQANEQNSSSEPYPFNSAKELLDHAEREQKTIAQIMMANECSHHTEQEVKDRIMKIKSVMLNCVEKGLQSPGILPGGLRVKRRAPELFKKLESMGKPASHKESDSLNWLNTYAIAVNEENAAGGRVVTAPTNGAAGIIPAVMCYYLNFYPNASDEDIFTYFLTAGAIAILYKKNASISGAEVGCQGEVGVACSMAAAGLTAVLGGTLSQIENAAEIAMEHHLGMTCDPIGGLVQIPCIERNAMGAVKAVNATRLSLLGTGEHHVSLDKVIATMKQTGKDMMSIYKETSLGGLAANLIKC